MTRQEAIEILKPFRNCMVDQHGCPISDAVYALDTAIKALESQESAYEEGYTYAESRYRQALESQQWIPCSERLPEELEMVNITWVNHEPEPYYYDIKNKNFVATGTLYKGVW